MTCHHCKHNAEIARLRDVCSKCRLGEELAGDGSFSLDAVTDGTADSFLPLAPGVSLAQSFDPADTLDGERPAAPASSFSEEARDAVLRLVHEFAQLPPVVAQVFHALLNRRTVKDVADEIGYSKQHLHYYVKKAVARFPAFAAVYRATRARPECAPITPKPRQRRGRS